MFKVGDKVKRVSVYSRNGIYRGMKVGDTATVLTFNPNNAGLTLKEFKGEHSGDCFQIIEPPRVNPGDKVLVEAIVDRVNTDGKVHIKSGYAQFDVREVLEAAPPIGIGDFVYCSVVDYRDKWEVRGEVDERYVLKMNSGKLFVATYPKEKYVRVS